MTLAKVSALAVPFGGSVPSGSPWQAGLGWSVTLLSVLFVTVPLTVV
ncbi:hypothetical protein ACWD26_36125 [Streptomyces sp. NPDC002787]